MYGCGYISESSLGEHSFCRFSCIQAQISINKAFKLFKKKKKKKKQQLFEKPHSKTLIPINEMISNMPSSDMTKKKKNKKKTAVV